MASITLILRSGRTVVAASGEADDLRRALCGEPVTDGWIRLDNGSVVCAKHIQVTGKL